MADSGSSSATADAPVLSGGVRKLAIQVNTAMGSTSSVFPPKTAAEWDKYESEVRARTIPFAQRWEAFTDKLLRKAEKDREGREYGGDTDSDEENNESEDEGTEEDEEDSDYSMEEEGEEPMITEEKDRIEEYLPGSILAQVYDSDADESAYTESEDELDSESSSDRSVDEEMMDIDIDSKDDELDSVEDSDSSSKGAVDEEVMEINTD